MPELHAICWQDTMEPWGWEPAVEDVPEGALPDGPFFWERRDADAALAELLERAAVIEVERLREYDQHRHALQTERYEDLMKGKVPGLTAPGVSVNIGGQSTSEQVRAAMAAAAEPERLKTDEELLATARTAVEDEWSIQTYEVPERNASDA